MSWEDQGRQEHGWFGSGKGPERLPDASGGGMFGLGGRAERIQAFAYGTIGALPHALRARATAQYASGNLARLTEAMTAWSSGTTLSNAEFADRFFGRAADDPVVAKLHDAARDVGSATSHAELREGSEKVANAMQVVGLDSWPRFIADAGRRARDPATVAAIENSRQSAARTADMANSGLANRPSPAADFQQRLDIGRKLVQIGGSATSGNSTAVAQHLASTMSASQLQQLQSTGVNVIVVRGTVTNYRSDLKGVRPRGYPQGQTWDANPGTLTRNNDAVVATHAGPHGERELPGAMQSSSADVTLHEIGHAINRRAGGWFEWASDRSNFRRAYDQDAVKGPLAGAYYHQPDASAGRDEAFAESHAEFLTDPNAMQAQYPNLFAYWQRYYGGGK